MLPLNLPGIVITDRQQDDRTFTLHAGCEGRPEACSGCRSESFIGHGQHPQEIIDLPHHGRFMAIQLVRKRYRCKDCGNTFFHPLDWIDDDHRATRRFVDRVAKLGLERNFSDIGREYGISEHAVREIFNNRYREIIDTTQFGAPVYLGIDELNIAGAARGVVTNLSDNAAIEFLPKCTNEVFRDYFGKMPDRHHIKAVAMDCTKRYKDMVREFFPKAVVVADKFHITRIADLAVDDIRKEVHAGIDGQKLKLRLKKDKFVLKTRAANLTDWQRGRLEEWRIDFPDLGTAYDLKEVFYGIYDAGSRKEAKLRFDTWRASIPSAMWKHWSPILTTFGNWDNEIFAFFDVIEASGKRLTNAYTECQNGLTRAIDRLGRGYSFETLRVKLLLAPKKQGIITTYRTIRRKKAVEDDGRVFMMFAMSRATDFEDRYETVRVPERKLVTWGVDIAKLDGWLEEQETGQARLPEMD